MCNGGVVFYTAPQSNTHSASCSSIDQNCSLHWHVNTICHQTHYESIYPPSITQHHIWCKCINISTFQLHFPFQLAQSLMKLQNCSRIRKRDVENLEWFYYCKVQIYYEFYQSLQSKHENASNFAYSQHSWMLCMLCVETQATI